MLSIERLIYFLFSGKTNTSYKNKQLNVVLSVISILSVINLV